LPSHTDGLVVFVRCLAGGANMHRHLAHPIWHPHRTDAAPAESLSISIALKISPSHVGIWTSSSTCFHVPPELTSRTASCKIGSAAFAGLTVVTDRQTKAASRYCCDAA